MRIWKSHSLLNLVNGYLVDSPQPSNLSYLWNFGSLLAFCLVIQIVTGVTLAMHYNPSVLEAFNSVEHIMRDVNNGLLIRYLHSNTVSAFFFLVYLYIGRGLYYGSYKAPRTLVWTIGTVIIIFISIFYPTLLFYLGIIYIIFRIFMYAVLSEHKGLTFFIIVVIIRSISLLIKPLLNDSFNLGSSYYNICFYSIWCGVIAVVTAYIVAKLLNSNRSLSSLIYTFIMASSIGGVYAGLGMSFFIYLGTYINEGVFIAFSNLFFKLASQGTINSWRMSFISDKSVSMFHGCFNSALDSLLSNPQPRCIKYKDILDQDEHFFTTKYTNFWHVANQATGGVAKQASDGTPWFGFDSHAVTINQDGSVRRFPMLHKFTGKRS